MQNRRFNVNEMVQRISLFCPDISEKFSSLRNTIRLMDAEGYNSFEVEAIMRSCVPKGGVFAMEGNVSGPTFLKRLANYGYGPRGGNTNQLVMDRFAKTHHLELNEDGVICERGTCPGNPEAGTTLVPIGTPACCNPHREQYWSQ